MLKKIFSLKIATYLFLFVVMGASLAFAAPWTGAPGEPPTLNTEAPINSGGVWQKKTGTLNIGGSPHFGALWARSGLFVSGDAAFYGSVRADNELFIPVGQNLSNEEATETAKMKAYGICSPSEHGEITVRPKLQGNTMGLLCYCGESTKYPYRWYCLSPTSAVSNW